MKCQVFIADADIKPRDGESIGEAILRVVVDQAMPLRETVEPEPDGSDNSD